MKRLGLRALLVLLVLGALLAAAVFALNRRDESPVRAGPPEALPGADQIARGAYLASMGNCAACHTARGGAPYAGARAIETPFGTVYSTNLTPDPETGLGQWNADEFWRALHNGRSKDGRLLYPAFPYPNFTQVTREDSDALFAFLRTLPRVKQPQRPHELRFPYSLQASLAVWRAMFFSPGVFQPASDKPAEWNRGAYLVRGLGHCEACHAGRNIFGATASSHPELSGGLIPMQNWYAPSLSAGPQPGVADWSAEELAALLKTGSAPRGTVMGPMAEVVLRSTQHLSDADLAAMVAYIRDLPRQAPEKREPNKVDPSQYALGEKLYKKHCADCHGAQGQGAVGGVYPPLRGHWGVTADNPDNLLHTILSGGFAPATAGNPRPYGMPPFGQVLDDEQVAAVASYVRHSWGNDAPAVLPFDVLKLR